MPLQITQSIFCMFDCTSLETPTVWNFANFKIPYPCWILPHDVTTCAVKIWRHNTCCKDMTSQHVLLRYEITLLIITTLQAVNNYSAGCDVITRQHFVDCAGMLPDPERSRNLWRCVLLAAQPHRCANHCELIPLSSTWHYTSMNVLQPSIARLLLTSRLRASIIYLKVHEGIFLKNFVDVGMLIWSLG